MTKIFDYVRNVTRGRVWSGEEWNATVLHEFRPYFRRPTRLTKHKELLRAELFNLAQIYNAPAHLELLRLSLRTLRFAFRQSRSATLSFLADAHPHLVAADMHWMRFWESYEPPSSTMPVDARTNAQFLLLDNVLEGGLKPRLKTMFQIARIAVNEPLHPHVWRMDLGPAVSQFPAAMQGRFGLMLRDPEFGVPTNQWRNIASHKTYAMRSSRTLSVTYGKGAKSRSLTTAGLRRTVAWATRTHVAVRLAQVIFCIEQMDRLLDAGLDPAASSLSLSASLLHLSNALRTVGFEVRGTVTRSRTLTLTAVDLHTRSARDAIIHLSQALDRLAWAVRDDVAARGLYDRVAVGLRSSGGDRIATASVEVSRAMAWSNGELTQSEFIDEITFELPLG